MFPGAYIDIPRDVYRRYRGHIYINNFTGGIYRHDKSIYRLTRSFINITRAYIDNARGIYRRYKGIYRRCQGIETVPGYTYIGTRSIYRRYQGHI
ncbi:hypothetical protein MAR_004371 [Mya arenaria]|uniref:Uncharacterized protein n=1 Tax=Mya arenaria TaxID=6604 RepID=A0ABY7EZJ5_MYAAR|nr:hypothetical protein MAR_004371 [Mya arenaria]